MTEEDEVVTIAAEGVIVIMVKEKGEIAEVNFFARI